MSVYQLELFHEDVIMKFFMTSLERDARIWYKGLSATNISSLRDFHSKFNTYCKRFYLAKD
jgi:hypothetical protein